MKISHGRKMNIVRRENAFVKSHTRKGVDAETTAFCVFICEFLRKVVTAAGE